MYSNETSGTSFTGETTRIDQQEKQVKLSTLIASTKDEMIRLAKAMEKQEQELDDLEQYRQSNYFVFEGNNLDHRLSNIEIKKACVISTLNSDLNLPFTVSEKDIDICHLLSSKSSKKIIIKFVHRSVQKAKGRN